MQKYSKELIDILASLLVVAEVGGAGRLVSLVRRWAAGVVGAVGGRVARHAMAVLVAVPLVCSLVLLLLLVGAMATAAVSSMLLVLHGLDALAGIADALAELAQVQLVNVLGLLARLVGSLHACATWPVELTHVHALVEQVLPAQLLVVHRRVGCFSGCRVVPHRAGAAVAVAGRTSLLSCVLRCFLSLHEHLLLIVLGHDAHLLVAGARAGSSVAYLRLVALLVALSLPGCSDCLHAARVPVLLLLLLRAGGRTSSGILLVGTLEIYLASVVLVEDVVHAGEGGASMRWIRVLQEASACVALL